MYGDYSKRASDRKLHRGVFFLLSTVIEAAFYLLSDRKAYRRVFGGQLTCFEQGTEHLANSSQNSEKGMYKCQKIDFWHF